MTALTLTLIGRDRVGLVRSLSERVAAAGGNWLESRMARLAGQFAGILLVDVPEAEVEHRSLARTIRGCAVHSALWQQQVGNRLCRCVLV